MESLVPHKLWRRDHHGELTALRTQKQTVGVAAVAKPELLGLKLFHVANQTRDVSQFRRVEASAALRPNERWQVWWDPLCRKNASLSGQEWIGSMTEFDGREMPEGHKWKCPPSFCGVLRNDQSDTARCGRSKGLLKDDARTGERVP